MSLRFTRDAVARVCLALAALVVTTAASAQVVPLDPTTIDKFVTPLVIPPVQPPVLRRADLPAPLQRLLPYDTKYEIGVRAFQQQVLPPNLPKTTVFGYGNVFGPPPGQPGSTFNYPAFTVEAKVDEEVNVTWSNLLVDGRGRFVPHVVPVDQTLHWANPTGVCMEPGQRKDCMGVDQAPYRGPVPIVVHLHGAHVRPESDGFPEAWYLPPAVNIPRGYETRGTRFDGVRPALPGTAVFQYSNDQRATTLWYHDHTLGMTRANVYAGMAGFWLLRDATEASLNLPGPAPRLGDPPGKRYYEIPIVIQDRSFNSDGSLFFPAGRDFFEGFAPGTLAGFGVRFAPDSDVAPIWNPEFFGNTMVVNGRTWPFLDVEARRYRFRFLNGSDSRFLILGNDAGLKFHQIGNDQGLLPAVVPQDTLLLGPAERADVIVDFTGLAGREVTLLNLGPDEPFGGGAPGVDFASANPETTGRVMRFRVGPAVGPDTSVRPERLVLPPYLPLGPADARREVTLNEVDSQSEIVCFDVDGAIVGGPVGDPPACPAGTVEAPFGPTQGLLGSANGPLLWTSPITENPRLNATEIWEIRNNTVDAHPIHVHQVAFEIVDRTPFLDPDGIPIPGLVLGGPLSRGPEAAERGAKDTVIALPGEITRIKARFDIGGLYVWHCHILSHEDNEMMRPFFVGNPARSPLPVDPNTPPVR